AFVMFKNKPDGKSYTDFTNEIITTCESRLQLNETLSRIENIHKAIQQTPKASLNIFDPGSFSQLESLFSEFLTQLKRASLILNSTALSINDTSKIISIIEIAVYIFFSDIGQKILSMECPTKNKNSVPTNPNQLIQSSMEISTKTTVLSPLLILLNVLSTFSADFVSKAINYIATSVISDLNFIVNSFHQNNGLETNFYNRCSQPSIPEVDQDRSSLIEMGFMKLSSKLFILYHILKSAILPATTPDKQLADEVLSSKFPAALIVSELAIQFCSSDFISTNSLQNQKLILITSIVELLCKKVNELLDNVSLKNH
ncbi:hypothetical protein BB560_006231, partial [Smittium megazygosporum]